MPPSRRLGAPFRYRHKTATWSTRDEEVSRSWSVSIAGTPDVFAYLVTAPNVIRSVALLMRSSMGLVLFPDYAMGNTHSMRKGTTMVAKFLMAAAAAALAVAPAAAAPANPAASLSVAKSVRTGSASAKKNELAGGGLIIALVAAAAVVAGIVIVADDNGDSN